MTSRVKWKDVFQRSEEQSHSPRVMAQVANRGRSTKWMLYCVFFLMWTVLRMKLKRRLVAEKILTLFQYQILVVVLPEEN